MLALDGAMASSITAPLDAFRIANALYLRQHPTAAEPFQYALVQAKTLNTKSVSKLNNTGVVNCAGGFDLKGFAQARNLREFDLLVIPGIEYRGHEALQQKIANMQEEMQIIRQAHALALTIAASCSGTFLLAASGVLDGHTATTSWWLSPIFKREFPNVVLDTNAIFCSSANLITAGATTAMFTAVIRYIERKLGSELAQNTARFLLVDFDRQSQAMFVNTALMAKPQGDFCLSVDRYLQKHLHEADLSIEALAAHCRMSARTLVRRFQSSYHKTPQQVVQQLRIERAKTFLETSSLTLEAIVDAIGYTDLASFRKLFKRMTDVTPNQYRQRFGARGA
jgi:transcriptional regulator GlxA family with amidase domain